MKRKGVFIAAGIVLVLLVGGILIYLSVKNPEILTKSPIEQPTTGGEVNTPGGVTESPTGVVPGGVSSSGTSSQPSQSPAESAGRCLVTTEANCSKVSILHTPEGARRSGIGFSDIAAGTKIFAPIDGYVSFFTTDSGPDMLILSPKESWSPAITVEESKDITRDKALVFISDDIKSSGSGFVKKGDQIGVVNPGNAVRTKTIKERVTLFIMPDPEWDRDITRSDDPVEYISQMIKLING